MSLDDQSSIGIVGSGAWGTALAVALQRPDREIVLWARESEVARDINERRENRIFLPGVTLPEGLVATTDLARVARTEALLLVVPAQHMRAIGGALAPHLPGSTPAVICAKGIEQQSSALMSEIVAETLPRSPLAVLSGPTFASEVARGLPAAVTLAIGSDEIGRKLIAAFGSSRFRPYLSDDVIGAQIGGAVKNVLAIASGIVSGRGLGENARAAIITRGLREMVRLGESMGARMETLMGLSGAGDLMLTCMSAKSRNFSVGFALGEGKPLADALGGKPSVAEGVFSASAVSALAERKGIEMPISQAVDAVVNRGVAIDRVIEELLSRPFTSEYAGRQT
jgi:glycerol-3-phosphate dehydrogenase (NAD(P)+)